jgi:hypothetical protein
METFASSLSVDKIPFYSQQFLFLQREGSGREKDTVMRGERRVDLRYLPCQKPSVFFRRYIKTNDSRTHNPEYDNIDIYFTIYSSYSPSTLGKEAS